jgi:hypothetical protein
VVSDTLQTKQQLVGWSRIHQRLSVLSFGHHGQVYLNQGILPFVP